MSCIDNIVSLGICPDEVESLSGFKLIEAPGISPKNLSNIATDFDVNGITMAMSKKSLAIRQFRNDFYGALAANKVIPMLPETKYDTSYFKPEDNKGTYDGYRGVVLNKNASYRGILRQTFIESVELFPLFSGDTDIRITIGSNTYVYSVTVVANQVNTFDADNFEDFPLEIPYHVRQVKVLVDQSELAFASSYISCGTGCNGTQPNECGWAEGWDGTAIARREGYGVNVKFYCKCNYDRVMCDLSNSFSGELIWIKWQIAIFQEQILSNRFNNWVVYNKEQIEEKVLPNLINEYNNKWNAMMSGLFGILANYKDNCLDCRKLHWRTNI